MHRREWAQDEVDGVCMCVWVQESVWGNLLDIRLLAWTSLFKWPASSLRHWVRHYVVSPYVVRAGYITDWLLAWSKMPDLIDCAADQWITGQVSASRSWLSSRSFTHCRVNSLPRTVRQNLSSSPLTKSCLYVGGQRRIVSLFQSNKTIETQRWELSSTEACMGESLETLIRTYPGLLTRHWFVLTAGSLTFGMLTCILFKKGKCALINMNTWAHHVNVSDLAIQAKRCPEARW